LLVAYFLEEIDEIATSDLAKKEDSTQLKVSLSFELSRSHILTLNKAEVKFDETVIEEVIPEPKKKEEKSEDDDEKSEEDKSEDEDKEEVAEIEVLADLIETEKEYVTKIVPHTIP
jgi:hypothetical protein